MLRVSGGPGEGASFQSRQSDSDKSSALQTESDDNGWFRKPARDLLGSDPGLALHVLLEIAPASGYRYASGERSMPLNQFRRLVHGKQGKQWLAAFMDGCAEPWWLEYRRAASIGERVLEMTKRE